MLTNFTQNLEESLGEKLLSVLFTPAFGFWAGGFAAWLWSHGQCEAWCRVRQWFSDASNAEGIVLLLCAVLLLLASTVIVKRLNLSILRLLEGYWPQRLRFIRDKLTERIGAQVQSDAKRWNELAHELDTRSAAEKDEYIQLDRKLRSVPASPDRYMPTRVGNLLRASESRPFDKYGLDAVKCWAHLWLVLPEELKKEVATSRSHLDAACALWTWGLLFLVWTPWSIWAAVVSVLVMLGAYRRILSAAGQYGDLIEACFDVHRFALYDALHWPRPGCPAEEGAMGAALTEYLWRGSDAREPRFVE